MIAEHELVKEAFEALRAAYTKAALSVATNDDLGRYRYMEALRQVDAVERHLQGVVTTGELAARDLAEMNPPVSLKERIKRAW